MSLPKPSVALKIIKFQPIPTIRSNSIGLQTSCQLQCLSFCISSRRPVPPQRTPAPSSSMASTNDPSPSVLPIQFNARIAASKACEGSAQPIRSPDPSASKRAKVSQGFCSLCSQPFSGNGIAPQGLCSFARSRFGDGDADPCSFACNAIA